MKKDIIKRWLKKAEADLKTAKILLEVEDAPTESICFHAQQAVEKFLKAYLTFVDVRVGKTHDIATLLRKCLEKNKNFQNLDIERLEELTFYAVEVRYPEGFYIPTLEEANEAVKLAEQTKDFVMTELKSILE